ncbi:FCS-Like Zinc finger 13-like [Abrus precatorius]|uniref:FCS-Like Zinc finger 13-like n=1 Tax=Abrus precatorius TaxID=3816 RepID=A0A8B8JHJ5_ABRPR|nr:FCS-Like Zinc finger 13-like [Abrus precatorius]
MLGKRPRPMIGKLSELLVSRGRAVAVLDTAVSPRGPLDMKMQSPRGLKSYDLGGVGLGIVVALDKSSEGGRVCASNLNRSGPIPVQCMKNPDGFQRGVIDDEIDVGSLEEYTYVTCHVPNKTFTKVYYDGGEGHEIRHHGHNNNNINVGVLRRTTPPTLIEPESSFPTSNFLNSCHLCAKKLHGKDIYMYRGEKAFCSPECRSSQIMMDERKERCRSEASRSVELSSSPYTREQIFSTGILAL